MTIDGQDVGRETMEKVSDYLDAVAPHLTDDFTELVIDMGSDYGELSDWLTGHGLPASVAEIAGDVPSHPPVLPYATIGQVILSTGTDLSIPNDDLLALVADLDIVRSFEQAKAEGNTRQWKKDTDPLIKNEWVFWTSCFGTARRLFALLKAGTTTSGTAAGGDDKKLRACMWNLCIALKDAEARKIDAIFKVEIGASDHAFSIIAQGGRFELLQSFAGESGESLVMNAKAGKVFSASTLCQHLINVCNAKAERKASSEALFDGEVMLSKEGNDLWPSLSLTWEAAPIPVARTVIKTIQNKIKQNLEVLKKQNLVR